MPRPGLASALLLSLAIALPACAQDINISNGQFQVGNKCQPLQDLSATLYVTQDMIANTNGGDLGKTKTIHNGGFSLQFNANPLNKPQKATVFWLQFILQIKDQQATTFIQYWDDAGVDEPKNINMLKLPDNILPAGYTLGVKTTTNHQNGNITGAELSITDNTGKTYSVTMPSAQSNMPRYAKTTKSIEWPAATLMLNIVGPPSYETSMFTSGAGFLTYSVSSGTLQSTNPALCGLVGTAERSNVVYSNFNPSAGGSFLIQPFTTPNGGALTSSIDSSSGTMRLYHFAQLPPEGKKPNIGVYGLYQFSFKSNWQANVLNTHTPTPTIGSPIFALDNTLQHRPELFYFNLVPKGGQNLVELYQDTSSSTPALPNKVMDISQSTALFAAMGSHITGFVDSNSATENLFFQGLDKHLHHLFAADGGKWIEDKELTTSPELAFDSSLTSHASPQANVVYLIAADRHIIELRRHAKTVAWRYTDLMQQLNIPKTPLIASPLISFFDSPTNADLLFYIGTDYHIHELRYSGNRWTTTDLTFATKAPLPGPGSTLTGHINSISKSAELFYIAADNSIWQLNAPQTSPPTWQAASLTKNSNGNLPVISPGSSLTTLINTTRPIPTDELFYLGADSNLYEIQWTQKSNKWSLIPNQIFNAAKPAFYPTLPPGH